ncbi:MAG: FMN-binding protein [Dermatophilaceae bacterium]
MTGLPTGRHTKHEGEHATHRHRYLVHDHGRGAALGLPHLHEQINGYALPVLDQEVVQQQSASIDTVSGATVTSDGYLQSLQSAIDQAHL